MSAKGAKGAKAAKAANYFCWPSRAASIFTTHERTTVAANVVARAFVSPDAFLATVVLNHKPDGT